jgi:class 3 adenylate cyclase
MLVGSLVTTLAWTSFFSNILSTDVADIILVISNTCGQLVTFKVNGPEAIFVGEGDFHDSNYAKLGKSSSFASYPPQNISTSQSFCEYTISVFPSEEFRKEYDSNDPLVYTAAVMLIMSLTICIFCLYDFCGEYSLPISTSIFVNSDQITSHLLVTPPPPQPPVEKRQERLSQNAAKSNALVSSLFPELVRDQLLDDAEAEAKKPAKSTVPAIKNPMDVTDHEEEERPKFLESKPIAELFPDTTIMFGDIVGFTPWSSVREPSQVFTLLETIYNAFDAIAKKSRVFKVETIGESYVAVCGLPEPRKDHAVVMARFAYTCMIKMEETVKQLELSLGPDTADLSMRFGLHSGPVTGGVLRGKKSRFQLFGDTVNTAARMETTATSRTIHMSQATADRLKATGKQSWVRKRDGKVWAKGKGELQTYWLDFKKSRREATTGDSSTNNLPEPIPKAPDEVDSGKLDAKALRLLGWNVEMLLRSLKQIVAMRAYSHEVTAERRAVERDTVLDEVQEIIALPPEAANFKRDSEDVEIDSVVVSQLRDYVHAVATMYGNNPFHNFEHASHVTMSATKLLSRIVSPHDIDYSEMSYKQQKSHTKLHQQTYGITSDPLTHFAITLSALIHDVDHPGVPNAQLVKEKTALAVKYKDKSVAEQNSVDLAWNLLMGPKYENLVRYICTSKEERMRFRQLIVNSVMATDIVDKELGALRRQRWEKAFNEPVEEEDPRDTVNRKATIVIEHLIQASDVAHTMQHWHVYQKWNEKVSTSTFVATQFCSSGL